MNEENNNEEIENTEVVGNEEVTTAEDTTEEAKEDPRFNWYIAHVLSGYEGRVSKTLKERILNYKMSEYFAEILVPEETVVTNVNGKKRNIKKKFFPGYLLVKMIMTKDTWHIVKNTDKVTGFIGGTADNPLPISTEEANRILGQAEEGFKKPRSESTYNAGDSVKVIEGPFKSFVGTVEAVSPNGKLKVNVSIFGRPTPVELDDTQVEKE